jgi:ABC-2 type transport system permease protein/lipopolysaccharide transport system permease protein
MSFSLTSKIFDSKVHDSYFRYALNNLRDLRAFRFALYNFVLNNLRMRYRRSVLGFVWSLLNPLMVMTVISLVFSVIFKQDIRTYAIYIFSGLAPWGFMSGAIQGGAQCLIVSEGFLKKVYLPKLLFPVIFVTTETVNFLFSLVSLYILALILGSPVTWRALLLPLAIIITYFFVLGCVTILSVASVYFRDLTQITTVVFTALFYLVPIIYPIEAIPEKYRILYYLNPFYYFVLLFRKVIYGSQAMYWHDWGIPLAIAFIVFAVSLFVLMKRDRDIIYRL